MRITDKRLPTNCRCHKSHGKRSAMFITLLVLGCLPASFAASLGATDPILLQRTPATTYVFSSPHWWESPDHQVTSLITHLTLSQNISGIAVIPTVAGRLGGPKSQYSLLGDFYDIDSIQRVQDVVTTDQFLKSKAFGDLKQLAEDGKLSFPKASHEIYERTFGVLSSISQDRVSFGMPHEDLENTEHYCSSLPGSVHTSADGSIRFIFLDRVHFYHFCTEKHMPWWYSIRLHLLPRNEYFTAVSRFAESLPKPITVVHVRDMMDKQTLRDDQDIQQYARQIADAVRRTNPQTKGTLYLSFPESGHNAHRVAALFMAEYPTVKKCADLYNCGRAVEATLFNPPLDPVLHRTLFETTVGASLVEVALSMHSEYFVGNVHSPYSRNVGLYRKLHAMPYEVVKGFGEQRKTWRWNL
jgi:hypothetical protein